METKSIINCFVIAIVVILGAFFLYKTTKMSSGPVIQNEPAIGSRPQLAPPLSTSKPETMTGDGMDDGIKNSIINLFWQKKVDVAQAAIESSERETNGPMPLEKEMTLPGFTDECRYDVVEANGALPNGDKCTVPETDMQVGEYIRNLIQDNQRHCGNTPEPPITTTKQHRSAFLNFRHQNWENSHQNDVAYRVAQLYLDGADDKPRMDNIKGKTIKQIYDDTIREVSLYDKKCVRMPTTENVNNTNHYTAVASKSNSIVQDLWVYENDKVMNGKNFYDGVMSNDPYSSPSTSGSPIKN